jgi:hypothetical protein
MNSRRLMPSMASVEADLIDADRGRGAMAPLALNNDSTVGERQIAEGAAMVSTREIVPVAYLPLTSRHAKNYCYQLIMPTY